MILLLLLHILSEKTTIKYQGTTKHVPNENCLYVQGLFFTEQGIQSHYLQYAHAYSYLGLGPAAEYRYDAPNPPMQLFVQHLQPLACPAARIAIYYTNIMI